MFDGDRHNVYELHTSMRTHVHSFVHALVLTMATPVLKARFDSKGDHMAAI